jgi:hypothetical protein
MAASRVVKYFEGYSTHAFHGQDWDIKGETLG